MRKAEYRCNHCMIVESKWLMSSDRASDYIACRKCGLESEKIGAAENPPTDYTSFGALDPAEGKIPDFQDAH